MADSDRKPDGFVVTDRRAFDASGERKENVPVEGKPVAVASGGPETTPASAGQRADQGADRPLPPADFATLVLSLGSSAIAYMGETPETGGQGHTRNLPMAKHAIDLLSVLEEKTKGNLSPEEKEILDSLLFDLRLRYVEAVKPGATKGA